MLLTRSSKKSLKLDTKRYKVELTSGAEMVRNEDLQLRDLPSPRLTVILQKLWRAEELEPAIAGEGTRAYKAAGVLAQDGSVYFAPCDTGKVLRITAEGRVELLEPAIPGGFGKYIAAGVLAEREGMC